MAIAIISLSSVLIITICKFIHLTTSFELAILKLEKELQIFKKCSINIVLNHINFPYNAFQDESYNLKPFQVTPIILSVYRFNILFNTDTFDLSGTTGYIYCDGHKTRLAQQQQGFHFRALPNPKSSCRVQVYIDPAPCKKWGFDESYFFPYFYQNWVFGDTFLDPIFYHSRDKLFNIGNSGSVFIHVMKPRKLIPYLNEMLFKVDYYWQSLQRFHSYSLNLPTKLIFQILKFNNGGKMESRVTKQDTIMWNGGSM